jgi:diguanylate cyclase (GGDEF)-like protein
MISMLIRDIKTGKITNSQAIQLAGMIALTISFAINVFFYYLEVAGVYEQILLSKVAVPVGALCMVFAALINYYIYISDSYARKKENASLAHLAYADGLTGLPNRSKFEQYLTDLDKSDKNYCILSIDLNGLKSVNDRSGHLIGDRYLLEFSKALRKSAPEDGFIARIGGDEFVMILTGNSLNKAEDVATKLSRELELYNAADKRIKRSAALGYAYRHEAAGADYHDVYLLADQRMYANKSAMKTRARHNA